MNRIQNSRLALLCPQIEDLIRRRFEQNLVKTSLPKPDFNEVTKTLAEIISYAEQNGWSWNEAEDSTEYRRKMESVISNFINEDRELLLYELRKARESEDEKKISDLSTPKIMTFMPLYLLTRKEQSLTTSLVIEGKMGAKEYFDSGSIYGLRNDGFTFFTTPAVNSFLQKATGNAVIDFEVREAFS